MIGYVFGTIRNILAEMRSRRVVDRSISLSGEKRYAEAARLYSEYAATLHEVSPLVYCVYSKYSLEEWVKAGSPDEALGQARNALQCLASNEGEMLKYNSGEFADTLLEMTTHLYEEGYVREAETFASELNEKLEEFKVPIRCLLDPAERNTFPTKCESCGGSLPSSTHQESISCLFCFSTVYAR